MTVECNLMLMQVSRQLICYSSSIDAGSEWIVSGSTDNTLPENRCQMLCHLFSQFFLLYIIGASVPSCRLWYSPDYNFFQQEFRRFPRNYLYYVRELHTNIQSVLYLEFAVAYVTHYILPLVQLMTFISKYSSKELVKLLGPSMYETIN